MFWLRKAIARLALSRSDADLIKAAGGVPREINGVRLDARFQFLEETHRQSGFDWREASPERARTEFGDNPRLYRGPRPPGVQIRKVTARDRTHAVPSLLYLPYRRDNRAAMLVFFHGGGGVTGDARDHNRLCALIARNSGAPVLSPDYRLAPENRFPAGFDDARAAYFWAKTQAGRYGGAVGKVAIGGAEIGAGFAAAIAQEAKGRDAPVLQLLVYPLLDPIAESASVRDYADIFPLTIDARDFYLRHYLPNGIDINQPRILPARAKDLRDLPRTFMYVAGFDILRDQAYAYAKALSAAGNEVMRHTFETLPNGFASVPAAAPAAEAAIQTIARDAGQALKRT